ncbi:hypothetical protein Q3G72_016835 [Acer saccharum]|nr:hypothetical protein Q3G72_016835 [Acer saccharum]
MEFLVFKEAFTSPPKKFYSFRWFVTLSICPNCLFQEQAVSDYNKNGRGKSLVSDDDAMNCAVTGVDGHIEVDKERGTPWQRSK